MRALDRKLLRDLWHLRGHVVAVAMIVASGVALMVMALSSHKSLEATADAYYERYRFADVFATVTRAPDRLTSRIAEIPGVQAVETRVVRTASLDIAGTAEPVIGQLVSVPERHEPRLNALAIRAGRSVAPGRPDEVVISEPFAEAHQLLPGSTLKAIMNGKRRELTVVGIALSPEFVYAIGPGALMPDDRRFGILWLGRDAMAAAYDFEGAFNSVSLSLQRDTDPQAVISRLDILLSRYGGTGAIARADQISNWFLTNELRQLRTMALILPAIFLAVAAFLTQMVMARLIATERGEIGLMKAFGYSHAEIGWHYTQMAGAMTAAGIVLGWMIGSLLGSYHTRLYADFFTFPFLFFQPGTLVYAVSAGVSLAAALLGALDAVRRASALPPAEAMRPAAPPAYRHGALALPVARLVDQPTRIVLRQITRWPARSLLTSTGVAMSVGVLIMALQWLDSIDRMVAVEFDQTQRQDVMLAFVEAQPRAVLYEVERLTGVQAAEPVVMANVTFHAGPVSHRGAITGLRDDARLMAPYDAERDTIVPPQTGLVMATRLAEKLGVDRGDRVEVEVREGRREVFTVPVVDLIETYIGTPAYMEIGALRRALREPYGVDLTTLAIDENAEAALFRRLKEIPDIAAVMVKRAAVDTFYDTMGDTVLIFISFFAGFAAALGFGVTYNSARIALSERGRDLATLRVLGFTRGEIAYILLGEVGLLVCLGLPLGCLAGWGLAFVMAAAFDTELFRIPLVVEHSTYGYGIIGAIVTGLASAALLRRQLDRLDIVAVLKTRE